MSIRVTFNLPTDSEDLVKRYMEESEDTNQATINGVLLCLLMMGEEDSVKIEEILLGFEEGDK